MATTATELKTPKTVSHADWLAARKQFLEKEKEFTRLRDKLSKQRRELPRERVEKKYFFEGPRGKETLADLFSGRNQLVIYHFMFGPGWSEGCPSCSYLSDHYDGMTIHLAHRDVAFAVISRATSAEIAAFKKRMGWRFHWVSSFGSDFNYDYHVSFTKEERDKSAVHYNYTEMNFPSEEGPGLSVFQKDPDGQIYHTYSTFARGLDILVGTYNVLDLVPKGRDEEGLAHSMAWVRHHDKYEGGYSVDPNRGYEQPKPAARGSCCEHRD